jgi:hypothetical protein
MDYHDAEARVIQDTEQAFAERVLTDALSGCWVYRLVLINCSLGECPRERSVLDQHLPACRHLCHRCLAIWIQPLFLNPHRLCPIVQGPNSFSLFCSKALSA